MSAHSQRRLAIEDDARLDIEDILLYTLERWGGEQRRRYRARLRQAMRRLVDHPEFGRRMDHLFIGCRGLVVEQHIIFYRLTPDEIIVGRVLHSSQDPTGKVHP